MSMDELVTVGAIVVLLVVIHSVFAVYLYRAFSTRNESDVPRAVEHSGPTSEPRPDGNTARPSTPAGTGDRSTVRCPVCGVSNDPSFQYCRRCVSALSDQTTTPTRTVQSGG